LEKGIPDEQVHQFIATSGLLHAWPYLREFVQSACSRLMVPNLALPLLRVEGIKDVVQQHSK
jgi:hypothetical protein